MKKSYSFESNLFFENLTVLNVAACMFFIFIVMVFSVNPLHAQDKSLEEELIEEERGWNLRKKYASILGVEQDSLDHLQLYEMLDKWPEFVGQNPEKIRNEGDGIFAQYIYYLVYETKISSQVNSIYSDDKTYLFRDSRHLRRGDVLFFGKKGVAPDKVALCLHNNMVVYPSSKGVLQYKPLEEVVQQYSITPAKIVKDE